MARGATFPAWLSLAEPVLKAACRRARRLTPTPAACPPPLSRQGYLLDGAAGQLPELLAAALPKGAVRLSEPVVKLARSPSGGVVATTLEGQYEAGAVIVATPPHLAGRIQYEPPMDALRSQLTMNAPLVGRGPFC